MSYEKLYRHCLENTNKRELVDKIIYDAKYFIKKDKEIERLNKENIDLKYKIKKLIKYGYGTDMTLGEFKEFYKLGTGKDYDPKKCPEVK